MTGPGCQKPYGPLASENVAMTAPLAALISVAEAVARLATHTRPLSTAMPSGWANPCRETTRTSRPVSASTSVTELFRSSATKTYRPEVASACESAKPYLGPWTTRSRVPSCTLISVRDPATRARPALSTMRVPPDEVTATGSANP